MTIKKNSYSPTSLLIAAIVATGSLAGCGVEVRPRVPTFRAQAVVAAPVVVAETGPAPASPVYAPAAPLAAPDGVATVGQYQQSGGATAATAELITIGSTIVGRVAKGAPRYYAIDLAAGDSVTFKTYAKPVTNDSGTLAVRVLEPDEVALLKTVMYVHDRAAWERRSKTATAQVAGRHLLRVAGDAPIHFKAIISGAVPASF